MNTTATDAATLRSGKPHIRPARPYFSSGPCAKPPGWAPEHLATGSLGRSHRSVSCDRVAGIASWPVIGQ